MIVVHGLKCVHISEDGRLKAEAPDALRFPYQIKESGRVVDVEVLKFQYQSPGPEGYVWKSHDIGVTPEVKKVLKLDKMYASLASEVEYYKEELRDLNNILRKHIR